MNEKLLERIDAAIKVSKEMGSEIPGMLKEVKDKLESKGRSDYERGLNDIWEALVFYCKELGYEDRAKYYEVNSEKTSVIHILYDSTAQEFMAKHEAAMKKMEEEKEEPAKIRRGDKVRCVGRCEEVFDAIYLGEDDRYYHVFTKDEKPQALYKPYGWILIKYEGQHVDLDNLFD